MTYVLYEWRDNPMFCPIMSLLALAFADNAFNESGIKKPEDPFSLEIPHFKESLTIQWRPGCLETPIFRRQVNGTICDSTPLTFTDFIQLLHKATWTSFGVPSNADQLCAAQRRSKCYRTLHSARAERYHLLTLSRLTGHGSPAEPGNGPCTS